jgi:flagellar protein FliL
MFLFSACKTEDDELGDEALAEQSEVLEQEQAKEIGPTFDFGEMIINLSDEGSARYVKVNIVIELDGPKALAEAEKRDPQMRDIIIRLLSTETAEEMLSLEGRDRIKRKLIEEFGARFIQGKVAEVYYTVVLVQ